MSDDFPEANKLSHDGTGYPQTTRAAGIIWTVFGSLLVAAAIGHSVASGMTAVCILIVAFVFGCVFIYTGVKSIRGTAREILSNCIGSVLFGLLWGGFNLLVLRTLVFGQPGPVNGFGALIVCVYVACGIGFVTAGILAFLGRKDYRKWRKVQNVVRSD